MCLVVGVFVGIVLTGIIAGKKLRDQFIGKNRDRKPIEIKWLCGSNDPIHLVWSGNIIFAGEITRIETSSDLYGSNTLHLTAIEDAHAISN